MPKFNVTVYCEQTAWDSSRIIVEAKDAEAAKRKAMRNVKRLSRDQIIEWEPAEAETFESTGRYDVGEAYPADDDAEVTS